MLLLLPIMKQWQRLLAAGAILILLLTLLSPLGLSPAMAVGSVTVSINVPGKVAKGAEFVATVNVSEVANFDSASYDVSFNPSIIEFTSISGGKIGETDIPVVLNPTEPGRIAVVQNVPALYGVNGTGYLAAIRFHVLGSPGQSSNITLANGILGNNTAQEIRANWLGASVEVSVVSPVVAPVITPVVTPVIGGGLPSIVVVVSPGVSDVSRVVAANGAFTQDVTANSVDGKVKLGIPQMTVGKTKTDASLSTISITEMAEPPLSPSGASIVGLTYNLGPDGTTFMPAVTLTLTYDPAKIPEGVSEGDLVIAMWDDAAAQWLVLGGSTVDPVGHTVTVLVSHFTAFTVIASIAPAPEGKVVPSGDKVVPSEEKVVLSGDKVVLSGDKVTPSGDKVVPPEGEDAPAKPMNWGLIAGIVAGVVAVGLPIIFLLTRRRQEL